MNVYDFDGTIYNGDSSVDFFIFCMKRRPIVLAAIPHFAYSSLLYAVGKRTKEALKESFFGFLRFLPDTKREVFQFWELNNRKINHWYLKLRSNGDVIITASPDFLVRPCAEKLGSALIASDVNPATGKFNGLNCYGEEKVRRLRELCSNVNVGNFYSDSVSDVPLARLANSAYFVSRGNIKKWLNI